METEKPSVYLISKAEALENALDFFLSEVSKSQSKDSKQLAFLAQIEFWEWELDNLLYSFDSFEERAKAWDSAAAVQNKLAILGITVRHKAISRLRWSRNEGRYVFSRRKKVTTPLEKLQGVVSKWNKLIQECEQALFDDRQAQNGINLGAELLPSLARYRKVMQSSNETGTSG